MITYEELRRALLRATILWRERLYQQAQGREATAPWEVKS